jgi:hypothetical protein
MHVINPFTQNNLIFLSPFSKNGEALHPLCCVCYPWLLKWYASIAILCCYHSPKVDEINDIVYALGVWP